MPQIRFLKSDWTDKVLQRVATCCMWNTCDRCNKYTAR